MDERCSSRRISSSKGSSYFSFDAELHDAFAEQNAPIWQFWDQDDHRDHEMMINQYPDGTVYMVLTYNQDGRSVVIIEIARRMVKAFAPCGIPRSYCNVRNLSARIPHICDATVQSPPWPSRLSYPHSWAGCSDAARSRPTTRSLIAILHSPPRSVPSRPVFACRQA